MGKSAMNANQPLISICLTCYNAKDTIRRAVTCALSQTWENREIIIVDDCSSDGSWDILVTLAREHPDVRIIRHKTNSGYPAAINTLVDEARGEFIAVFDDDDQSVPERLRKQIERLLAYEADHGEALIICYTNRNIVRIGESTVDHVGLAIGHCAPEPYGQIVADYILGIANSSGLCWGIFGSCTMMVRHSVLIQLDGFDTNFRRGAEMDFAIRAAFAGAHFISVNEQLVTQYKTDTTDKSGLTDLNYSIQLSHKYEEYLRAHRAYGGAVALAHMRFHSARSNLWRARAWYLLALLRLPWRLTRERLRRSATLSRTLMRCLGRI